REAAVLDDAVHAARLQAAWAPAGLLGTRLLVAGGRRQGGLRRKVGKRRQVGRVASRHDSHRKLGGDQQREEGRRLEREFHGSKHVILLLRLASAIDVPRRGGSGKLNR